MFRYGKLEGKLESQELLGYQNWEIKYTNFSFGKTRLDKH